jgi:hypothetical protein
MARTAVIAGTATKVSGAVSHKQQQQRALQGQQAAAADQALVDRAAAQAAAQSAVAPRPAVTEPTVDRIGQLKELAELKAAGILTEAEFAAEKARVLGS